MAGMFVDGLCDGCVTAKIIGDEILPSATKKVWLSADIFPAVSIVAAPDFFPQFDPVDLDQFDKHFLEGGAEIASGLRLPANPFIKNPVEEWKYAFPDILIDRASSTVTAVVSSAPAKPPRSGNNNRPLSEWELGQNTLPDTMSNVFAPGWDITYSSTAIDRTGKRRASKLKFIASFGLGSPFPEDMKLCAAANGMWAGSSPDAARTYYAGLDAVPFRGRPATAVPLLDYEIGYHKDSSAHIEHGIKAMPGWDGEYGPFLRTANVNGELALEVDHADIMVADYVKNALAGQLDLGRMREISRTEILERMAAIELAIKKLPGKDKVSTTDMWLISAEKVPEWSHGADALGLPKILRGQDRDKSLTAAPGFSGKGWLYIFADCPSPAPKPSDHEPRLLQSCKNLYICQIAGGDFAYARIRAKKELPTELIWR